MTLAHVRPPLGLGSARRKLTMASGCAGRQGVEDWFKICSAPFATALVANGAVALDFPWDSSCHERGFNTETVHA